MLKYNPLGLMGFDLVDQGGSYYLDPVATEGDLPSSGVTDGQAIIVKSTDHLYIYDSGTSKWVDTGLTSAAVGTSPNANGYTITNPTSGIITRTQIELEPADSTHPGIISTSAQAIPGSKTFASQIQADGGIDVTATGGTDTLNIGVTNADVINIGNSGATVNLQGTTFYQNVTNLQVTDKLITVNKNGSAGSGTGSGIEIEEDSSATGYVKTSADRNSWIMKAPNTAGDVTLTPGAGGITLNQSSHNPVTLATFGSTPAAEGASLSTQALTLQPASASFPGGVSTTTQSFAGDKTFTGAITVQGADTTIKDRLVYNNAAGTDPKIIFNDTTSDLGLRIYKNLSSVLTEVARIQDNGTFYATALGTIGGFNIADFYMSRGASTGPKITWGGGGEDLFLMGETAGNSYLSVLHLVSPHVNTVGLAIKAKASQAANLQEWRNSSGTALLKVDKDGNINWPASSAPAASASTEAKIYFDSSANRLKLSQNTGSFYNVAIENTGDINETSFSGANNQVAAANVTGFAFAAGSVRSFRALVSVAVVATSSLYESFEILGINKAGTSFDISVNSVGDTSQVLFTVTSAGQIQYTSGNYAGFTSLTIKFRAITTTV